MTQHGFKKIALDLVKQYPGYTAEEYARMALDQGLTGSDSKDPIFSLRTTMMKEYREGRMAEVVASRVDGKQRFYPKNGLDKKQATPVKTGAVVPVVLIHEDTEILDMLVEIGKFRNRSEGLLWLAHEGIQCKEDDLNKAKVVLQQIRQLKRSITI